MKTSKRLLSFFLAVVMVITTCSVGFAAFAADDPEDQVFTYVTDEGEAVELTYSGLNELVNTYAPTLIELLREDLEGADIDVDAILQSDNPIGELLGQVAPTLFDLVGPKATAQSVLGTAYDGFSDKKYAYLEDSDAAMSFWNLYTMCNDNQDADGVLGDFCSSTLEKLDALLSAYDDSYYVMNGQIDDMLNDLLGSSGFNIARQDTSAYFILYNDSSAENYSTIFSTLSNMGMSGIVASRENIGGVLLKDGETTLAEWATEVQANGNIYDNGTSDTEDDIDLNPFIGYVSYYAGLAHITEEGATLTLLDALYYYYNHQLTADTLQNAGILLSNGNATYSFAQSFAEQFIGKEITITFEPGKYWYNSAYDATTGFTWKLFADNFAVLLGFSDPAFTNNNRYLLQGVYETVQFWMPIFSNTPLPTQEVYQTEGWYNSAAESLLVQNGTFASVDEAHAAMEASYFDEEELNLLYNLAKKYNFVASEPNLASIKNDYNNSSEATNEVLGYTLNYTSRFSLDVIEELANWNPDGGDFDAFIASSPYTSTLKNYVDGRFGIYYINEYVMGGAGSRLNHNYSASAKEVLDINYVSQNVISSYEYDDYNVTSEIWVEFVNVCLNDTISEYLDPDADKLPVIGANLSEILNNLLTTKVDLASALKDVYSNLANRTVEAIFDLVPVLVVIIDEVLIPLIFNGQGDIYGAGGMDLLNLVVGILLANIWPDQDYTQDGGSDEGVGTLSLDLNVIVPTLLHWILGDNKYTYTYYNRTENGDGTYTYGDPYSGPYGTKYTADNKLNYVTVGEGENAKEYRRVPVIFNIYYVDSRIADLAVKDLGVAGEGEDPDTKKAVGELVTQLVTFATETVDEYVAEHGEDPKSYNDKGQISNRGINNLLVAFPAIINDLGQKFLEKYNVSSDWEFGEFDYTDDGCRYNVSVQQFKDLVGTDDASSILRTFVDMFINNWLNALTDILNDVVSDTENDITSKIPIVTALLNSVDLFGETSILTDIFNGLFLVTRDHPDSFTFETQENGYVGLDTLSAYFLLANLNTIIDIVVSIIDANENTEPLPPSGGNDPSTGGSGSSFNLNTIIAPLIDSLNNNLSDVVSDGENQNVAKGLIGALDSLLSTLLSNSYMNGYQLDEVDGVLSSVVTTVTNVFGEDQADQVMYLVTEYLKVLNAGSANADGSANANANGPVDPDEVYTKENLSNIVTQTYVLVESLINDNLEDVIESIAKKDVVFPDNTYTLITSAVNGILSPSAIAVRSDVIDNGLTEKFSWADVAASGYATDLGYNFSDGDKDGFYTSLVDSLGVIPSILGVLLVDAGVYENVIATVFGDLCETMKIDYVKTLPDGTTGEEATLIVIEMVSDILGTFLNAPVSGILELLRTVVNIASDSYLSNLVDTALEPIFGELEGLKAILAQPAPTFPKVIDDKIINPFNNILSQYIPDSNILITIIGAIANTDLSIIPLNYIISRLQQYTGSNEELLLMLFTLLADVITDDSVFGQLVGNQYPWLTDLITKYDSASLLNLIKDIVNSIQSPKEIQWIFNNYNKQSNNFEYPTGITAQDAEDAVDSLDDLVANLFPLLKEFGVVDQDNLGDLLNGFIFTNANITALAKAVYGGIETASQNDADGIFVFSPAQFADYLMDSSYGATFSSAANTLRRCSTWSQVGTVNWGFTDGSAKAQEGFVKALAALTRPANDILAAFLAEGDANLAAVAAQILRDFDVNVTTTNGNFNVQIILQNSTLTINFTNNDNPGSKTSSVVIDLVPVIEQLSILTIKGGNGYESAIIPLLNAFNVECKSYDQYLKDYSNAKDSILINILNPIVDFLNDVTSAPFDTLTAALPKLAAFLDGNGLGKAVNNLLAPITDLIDVLNDNGINVDSLIEQIAGKSLKDLLEDLIGMDLGNVKLELTNLDESLNIQDILIPLVNSLLKDNGINIKLDDIDWGALASLSNQGQVLVSVLRYIENVLIKNAAAINSLLSGIDAIKNNKTILNILDTIFGQIATAKKDDIVLAVFYLLLCEPTNVFFDYTGFEYKDYEFTYPTTVDMEFLTILGPMLDGLIGGLIPGGLSSLVVENLYTDNIISSLATGLYGAIEGVKINDSMNLTELLAMTDIDFSTDAVADLLENKDYGQTYSSAARVIRNAGAWSRVNANSLSWGVTDRDSFVHALCAVLRPLYGVLDVLLNDGSLGLFNLIYLPGSDGYTSTIVPLLEAFGCYNIKTQYQYRQDMSKEYDYILIDVLNPLLDKIEDLLNAPIQTLADMLPNLALFFANDGLLQIIENLLTPIKALLDAVQPIADVNDILVAAGLDIEKELQKLGLVGSNYSFDIYNLSDSLRPLIGKDNIVSLLNTVLGMIEVGGAPLALELMPIDWYQLASHGEVITDEASQASTHGGRVYVDADPNEVLIAVLRYLVETINYKDNYSIISNLIGGLIGSADDSISSVVDNVLGILTGETDQVISDLCGVLETLA